MQNAKKHLRRSLWANVIFSTTCGIICLIAAPAISTWMQIGEPRILYALGIGLLFFAGSIVFQLRRQSLSRAGVRSIIIQDWLWVIGTALIIGMQAFGISKNGYFLMAGIAVVVMALALAQNHYLRKCKD